MSPLASPDATIGANKVNKTGLINQAPTKKEIIILKTIRTKVEKKTEKKVEKKEKGK